MAGNDTIGWTVRDTSLGAVLIAATRRGICRLSFDETDADLAARFPDADLRENDPAQADLFDRVVAAIESGGGENIAIDARGTDFQRRVWGELRKVPSGQTRTYAEIAAAIGSPGAARAVGGANAANPVAVLTPCHRVTRAGGAIGGYAYGAERKRALLAREGAIHA